MGAFYDSLETRSADERESAQLAALAALLAESLARAPGLAARLAGIDPAAVIDRAALARLPLIRKSELIEAQRAQPPFAGLTATPTGGLRRVFSSPGPIYDPEGGGADWWRLARALFAAGFRRGELVHNAFSYHFTPGGRMFESGAHALGCPVFPAGTGNTDQQARAVADLRPSGYAGTPSFLKITLDRADELGLDSASLTKACVSGEALTAALRQGFEARGIATSQCYATADLGLIAYETAAREGLVVDEGVIVEIVRPGTGDPVPDGEVGEVVVTAINRDYPLIRFATGDLSAVLAGPSPCGRTNLRLKGWMGRADQTTKIKGMFVHPHQIAAVLARHPELGRARLVVERGEDGDRLTLAVESAGAGEGLDEAVRTSFQAVCTLRAAVTRHAPGSLPNDGIVIEDRRGSAS
jgi:phenylacetate-CoA ligase